ncbi:hypothetical protein HHK36_002071 [Tetracentron sinense]|uniref:Gnk2-homologous domain-containing protein n=1 Tax=Tetracentron sinense TaxID=13715 RepID=A0A834ZXH9_TETSI|nr:hypothetical protein HHK36_002071 [Tetracentron sinense]
MYFSRTTLLYMLVFTLLLHKVVGDDPLYHFCTSSENYAANGPFNTNLKHLMDFLFISVPPFGFGFWSVGIGETRVNGLALCRGDVSSTDCKSCVVEANSMIRQRCPYKKGAIIWYDHCLLKYSKEEFFGKIDNKNKFYMWNVRSVYDRVSFNQKTKKLISRLSNEANYSPLLYATGELEVDDSRTLYGLVQCTRDLPFFDCKKCLDTATSELPRCCDGREGGRVIGGSCNFRYELYPFVNA